MLGSVFVQERKPVLGSGDGDHIVRIGGWTLVCGGSLSLLLSGTFSINDGDPVINKKSQRDMRFEQSQ
jgi:hypothetical protein